MSFLGNLKDGEGRIPSTPLFLIHSKKPSDIRQLKLRNLIQRLSAIYILMKLNFN